MAAKKIYAVKVGKVPGLYKTWDACKEQIHGYPNAQFKSFPTKEEAQVYLLGNQQEMNLVKEKCYHIYVDGSFNKAKKKYSWAFVVLDGEAIVHSDSGVGENVEAAAMHNVAGELAAAMHAIKWAVDKNMHPILIHHDYMGIGAWATGEWKAKNKFTQAYAAFTSSKLDWVFFEKVKGHSGVVGNEMADKLAGEALAGE